MLDPDADIRERALNEILGLLQIQEEKEEEERRKAEEEGHQAADNEDEDKENEDDQPPKKRRRKSKKVSRPPKPKKKVREFRKPAVDMTVEHYWNFIDDTPQEAKTIPPIFLGMSASELRAIAADPSPLDHLKKIPGNTQNVERYTASCLNLAGKL